MKIYKNTLIYIFILLFYIWKKNNKDDFRIRVETEESFSN